MTIYLSLDQLLHLYQRVMDTSGGLAGVRDLGNVESALAQPRITFDQEELYPTLSSKAAALGFALIQNHPFTDGNKRIGHAAMEAFLVLNGFELRCSVEEQESEIIGVASGAVTRESFTQWVERHSYPLK